MSTVPMNMQPHCTGRDQVSPKRWSLSSKLQGVRYQQTATWSGFEPRKVPTGFVVDKVALGQVVFSPSTSAFPCQYHSNIASILIHSSVTKRCHYYLLQHCLIQRLKPLKNSKFVVIKYSSTGLSMSSVGGCNRHLMLNDLKYLNGAVL
jgi:hypothetical protein